MAVPICLVLESQAEARALSRAWANTGKRMAARIAMIAMTTRSSINVNARRLIAGTPSRDTRALWTRDLLLAVVCGGCGGHTAVRRSQPFSNRRLQLLLHGLLL